MAKLGSSKRPAVVRVQTQERATEILSICNGNGWKVIVGVEPDQPEKIADVEKLLNPSTPFRNPVKVGRNEPCPCGSGLRYKKCCGATH
jgi:SWIM/SEC-C metal-binding protein